ncbi:N-acetylmuramoyl-L-alanine amidase family protein [Clostridium botulinum]|uniref:N-acetylmuramoyl-L-alanine amidase family protein n=1 Tax=Clostridium botulinum TaxID=1491 RepID=A0A6B4JGW4_CLOBO|nr:N-acetylmuramoyl-L-alanine amidase family protein [Clostridium botulinum]EES49443.1 cell wall binding repeat protein [Clostridium botulinum E1 str. 'BoNT E Beluga']MBY6759497.1 N-acetylmuramoyl-L-alanine amidase family protein [Clostridium botulinum]MBY6915002.1 N-acetylmuramoyl-L-alanine amidase family protein [Clostridium botulinum]MBY6918405.1 N-acetylmuramoyl-L-alanine amidase family protein [Clostridium botulinum]MCR1129488.1 N-acetylmuramoyl-L-alanine amidase family protein [Clostridi
MFNRANKMTALLVAAAAVVSLVPATGVNAAEVKRISSEDGKVYHAVAYKDGHFYVDGEVNDKDEAAYYLADGKYSELKDIDSNSEISVYGEKYVNIDGDYFVDLSNGKVTEDDVQDDNKDDAETALRKKVKDKADDRYSNHDDNVKLEELAGNKFGETWYKASYKAEATTNGSATELNVYTDAKGNYIDADYNLGKIKVEVQKTSTAAAGVEITDKNVTIDNTDSNKKVATNKDKKKIEVSAKITDGEVIAQDSKNIYRTAILTVSTNDADVAIKSIYGNTEIVNKTNSVELKVIQKISKEQSSDTVDGAKYAKSTTTYVMVDEDGKVPAKDDINTFVNTMAKDDTTKYTVVNGTLVAYRLTNSDEKVQAQAVNLKSKAGLYYVDAHGDSEEKLAAKTSYDVDIDGNLWRIDGGFVYKFDNDDDWDKVYKVDGSMEQISVYNKDNMVVWDDNDEVYSIIGQKDKEEEKPEVEVKAGWNQATDGTWSFVKADGTKATGWYQDGATWYLLNEAGIMQTGWQTVGGTWYYLAGNGAMQTGWQNVNGAWYYLLGNGAMQTGWINDNGTWYFADGSGKMLANTTVNGYVLGANGAWIK